MWTPSWRRRCAPPPGEGVRGPEVTPWVLARLHERTGGRTLGANRALVVANAAVAAEAAAALAEGAQA